MPAQEVDDTPTRGDDPEAMAAVAAVHLRAAAHPSEASILLRLSGGRINDEGLVEDDQFDRLLQEAMNALQGAAAQYERATDLLSRTQWALQPREAEYLQSLRLGVQVLNTEVGNIGQLGIDEDHVVEVDEAQQTEEDQNLSPAAFLLDRADTFHDKARQMAEAGMVFLDVADRLADRDC